MPLLQFDGIDSQLFANQAAQESVECLARRKDERVSGPVEFEASRQGRDPDLADRSIGTHDDFPRVGFFRLDG